MHAAVGSVVPARLSVERKFFLAMSTLVLFVVLVGFSRGFYLKSLFPDWEAARGTLFYVHGAIFTAWFVLLVVQAALITSGRVRLHMRIGIFGAVLAAGMVVVGTAAALVAANRPSGFVGVPVPPLQFLAVPLFDMALFAVFIAIAIAYRRAPATHKRMMLIASVSLLTAAFARWPGVHGSGVLVYFGLTDLCFLPIFLWDRASLGQFHPVTVRATATIVASQILRLAISGTPFWLGFAKWATSFAPPP